MMTNLIEIVFEQVSKSCIVQLFCMLINCSEKVKNLQCSEEQFELIDANDLSEDALTKLTLFNGDLSLIINVTALNLDDIMLPNIQLRLIKYGNDYDVDLNFDFNELRDIDTITLINRLHKNTQKLASKFEVTCFYGGMEPASDEDTRYFTDDEIGPL